MNYSYIIFNLKRTLSFACEERQSQGYNIRIDERFVQFIPTSLVANLQIVQTDSANLLQALTLAYC